MTAIDITDTTTDVVKNTINAGVAANEYHIHPGEYRCTAKITPLNDMAILGAGALTTILNFSKLLTGFTGAGPYTWTGTVPGPTTVTQFTTATTLYPWQAFHEQVYMDKAPLWKCGTRTGGVLYGSATPAAGEVFIDYDNSLIKVGTNPAGHVLECSQPTKGIESSGARAEIAGLGIFGSSNWGIQCTGANWDVHHCDIYGNRIGLGVAGVPSSVDHCRIHHNSQYGLNGDGDGSTVADCEINNNDHAKLYNAAGSNFAAGGMKYTNMIVFNFLRNNVHDNEGSSVWMDINCITVNIDGNDIHDNNGNGIHYEISYAGTITNNYLWNNVFDGLWLSTSRDVVVKNNKVWGNQRFQMRVLDANRTTDPTLGGVAHRGINNVFGGVGASDPNEVWFDVVGSTEGVQLNSAPDSTALTNNVWTNNINHLPATGNYFVLNGSKTTAQWIANGNDTVNDVAHYPTPPLDATRPTPRLGSPAMVSGYSSPAIVQSVGNALTAPGTTVSATWPAATTGGSRLLAILGVADNNLTVSVTTPPTGYVLVNPPGKITRQAAGLDVQSLWVYQKISAATESGSKGFTINQSCYASVVLIEIQGDDPAKTIDVQASNTGSAQTLLSGTTAATTVANALAIAAWVSGNKDLHSNLLPAGFTQLQQVGSGGGGSTIKENMTVAIAQLNATGTQSASVDVAGGFNHSYAAAVITVPADPSSGAGGGGTGGFTPWDDGKLYHGCTLDYFGAGTSLDTTAHSNLLAARCKAMVGWAVAERNDYGTFGPAIRALNPTIVMAHYNKSAVRNGTDPGNFGENWYAHTCAGARIPSGSAGLDTMQPDGTVSPAYSDSRFFTASTWRQWKAKDLWSDLDVYNAAHAGTLNGGYLDSLYTASFRNTNCNGATNTPYTKPQWVELVRTIADACRTERSTLFLMANGLGGGSVYYAADTSTSIPSSGLLDHVDMGLAEGWLRGNYDLWGDWPTLDIWQKCVNMMLDAQMIRGKSIWTISNVANDTSGSPPGNWVPYTTAQINQWRRFCVCTHMLGQRGLAMMEFVSAAPGTKPWAETHVYYDQNLGAPAVGNSSSVLADMAVGNGLYARYFTNGAVVVNPTGAGLTFTVGVGHVYNDPNTGSTYLASQSVTVPAHDGIMFTEVGTPANTPPVVTITGPANGTIFTATEPVTLTGTATDADGIGTATMRLDAGAEQAATLGGGVYSVGFGVLQPGSHTLSFTVKDANAAPQTVTKSVTVSVLSPPPPNDGPSVTVTGPSDIVVLPQATIGSCLVTDADGIASVTMSLDGELPQLASASGSTYTHDFGALAAGSHTLTIVATDLNAAPIATTVERAFLVVAEQGGGGGTGGGGGDQTTGTAITISTDFAHVDLRIRERGV